MDNEWKEIHYFDFKIARFTKTEKKPELVFLGSEKLIFDDNKKQNSWKSVSHEKARMERNHYSIALLHF